MSNGVRPNFPERPFIHWPIKVEREYTIEELLEYFCGIPPRGGKQLAMFEQENDDENGK